VQPVNATLAERIEQCLWQREDARDVWAILDGARDRRIFGLLLDSHLDYSCLYSGALPPELEIAAPYLVQLEPGDRYSRRLIERAWGNSWGVFLKCNASTERLRRHLRGFLRVQDHRGRRLVFRYYDPRVLRVYLPTCMGSELETVFGPIERFWAEAEDGRRLLEFRFERKALVRDSFAMDAEAATGTAV
jgi:hypothetical protein